MSKKYRILIISLLLVVFSIAVAVVIWMIQLPHEKENTLIETTDGVSVYDGTPQADPLLVGRWQNTANHGWHKVYYDDYDEETKSFWGKEWDESDDVYEENLEYHGNGWFRWKKNGEKLYEYSTMNIMDVPIGKIYIITLSSPDSLVYYEQSYKKNIFRFLHIR